MRAIVKAVAAQTPGSIRTNANPCATRNGVQYAVFVFWWRKPLRFLDGSWEGRRKFSSDLTAMSICFCFPLRFPDRIHRGPSPIIQTRHLQANRLGSEW